MENLFFIVLFHVSMKISTEKEVWGREKILI